LHKNVLFQAPQAILQEVLERENVQAIEGEQREYLHKQIWRSNNTTAYKANLHRRRLGYGID